MWERRAVDSGTTAAQEWKAGWKLVLACFFGFLFFSTLTSSMSVFIGPLAAEFGWSRTLLSAGVAMSSIVTALLSPFFGILLDRYGARRLALPGILVTSFAVSSIAFANGSPAQWLFLWGFYALISISVKTTVWTAAVAGVFDKAQGMALGLTLAGATAAHAVIPPLSNWLIETFGWRLAYVWLGLGIGSVTLILCYFFLYDAHDREGAARKQGGPGPPSRPDFPGLTLSQAWRDLALWRIGISLFVIMLLTIGLLVHQIEILTSAGVSRTSAAWLASLAGAMGIVGKLVTGVLLDRFRGNWVGGVTLGLAALAFALLIDGVYTPVLIVVAMLVNGYTAGAKLQIASYLTVRFSGMRNFGKIYGVVTSLIALGSGMGPLAAGAVYDLLGSYSAFLAAGAVGSLFAGALLLTLPRYPDWKSAGGTSPAAA